MDDMLSWSKRLRESIKGTITSNGSLNKHEFIIIGLGRFGTALAVTLEAYGHNVLATDLDTKRVQIVSNMLPHVVQLDATSVEALQEVGAEAFDTAVVCIGNDFEANILATAALRKLGLRRVITKSRTLTQEDILLRIGADEVILPDHEAGVRLARRLSAIDFVDFMELSDDVGVVEIVAPRQFVNKSLKEANIRQKYGLAVVAIKRGKNDVIVSPHGDDIMQENDILVVLGQTAKCESLRQLPR